MPESVPFIPDTVTVHLGRPNNQNAANVTVSFPDYIKNVASSELYPTWPENALRANIYAIISFTLNRIYTEWYRSQGYDFDITNSIQYDHSFVENRDIFEPISRIVDDIFNEYLVRQGSVEPLFATYCDGIEVTCDGLYQWGSVDLANQGMTPYEILTYYYGDDINIVTDADIRPNIPTYPGTPLTIGSGGTDVNRIEIQLNRISTNYPAIPKIYPVDVTYDDKTADAVREFQRIFNLPQTGVVDKATWYKINYIYTSVKKLSQLNSEGLSLQELPEQFPVPVDIGATGLPVQYIQYYLEVIGAYYKNVLPVQSTGTYDEQTANSVRSFQQVFGLPQTGTVDERTWDDLYRAYAGIVDNVPINTEGENAVLFPGTVLTEGMTSPYIRVLQEYLSYIHMTYPNIPDVSATGYFGPITRNAVIEFQKQFGLPQTGSVGPGVWDAISDVYSDLRFGYVKQPGQYPGYIIE
ncbi:MAG: spore cortex-lytic protein [Oscillospiraceae bacterium]|jgi:peptidoglycan hydrolase-like protein with peptidoglycan-binding domain|nr:spore cortex-lytic protein [Oscillospiraceae bacterium]MCX4257110.1 peptidoglycan-binding protein [Oscillospiraceae bacterium]